MSITKKEFMKATGKATFADARDARRKAIAEVADGTRKDFLLMAIGAILRLQKVALALTDGVKNGGVIQSIADGVASEFSLWAKTFKTIGYLAAFNGDLVQTLIDGWQNGLQFDGKGETASMV